MTSRGLAVIALALLLAGCIQAVKPSDEPRGPSETTVSPTVRPTGTVPVVEPSLAPEPDPEADPLMASSAPEPPVPDFAGARACRSEDLTLAGRDIGAATGNALAAITVRNDTSRRCAVGGYPVLVLLDLDRHPIHTVWRPALTGGYLFPAVDARAVSLEPGDASTVWIGYADNPWGPLESAPLEVACPASAAVRITLPGGNGSAVVPLFTGPCNGWIDVSPFVPGADPPRF